MPIRSKSNGAITGALGVFFDVTRLERLENAAGQQLAQDDDSGGMLNARIVFSAPADGWYRIIVTSFSPKASGNYTLRVR